MPNSIEEIIKVFFSTSELLEEELKRKSDLEKLTNKQLNCLELVASLKNPSSSELAAILKVTKASMSVMVDRLEKKGSLFRVASDSDRRSAHVHLTARGEEAARLHSVLHHQMAIWLTENLTELEKNNLSGLLSKGIQSLKLKRYHQ